MNLSSVQLFIVFALSSLLLFACETEQEIIPPLSPTTYLANDNLKSVSNFPVGTAVRSNRLNTQQWNQTVSTEFDRITGEYEMQQNVIQPQEGNFNWRDTDKIVDFATQNGMQVHGHALIWYQSAADWMHQYDGNAAGMEAAVKTHIQTVVRRYKGKIQSWDVVNEAIPDHPTIPRDDLYSRNLGPDFAARCFQYAHEADPDLLLFYNDYGTTWDPVKRQRLLNMLDDFQARGIPIHGVGLQLHISYDFPTITEIQQTVDELVQRELMVHFSELDISVSDQGSRKEFTEDLAQQQENRMRELVGLYLQIPTPLRHGITFWGLRDVESWLIDFNGYEEWPLLFDTYYRPKLMHRGFIEAFQSISN